MPLIGQVVLFSSGVGYFQREGTVDGDARVDLSFDVRDINDLIKSMVVRDLDGGQVAAVSYDSNAPVERTLQSFAIDLNNNPSATGILNQARGEKIEVVLQQTNAGQPGTMIGTIVGIESQKHDRRQGRTRRSRSPQSVVRLMACGSVKMREVQRIRFLSPVLDGEFRKALETLATSHDTGKKAVAINFTGEGQRTVRVGYVVENPIWKTSYRLVLDKEKKAAPYLQGWAVVENPTDEDWKGVRMALVSGRPISFQMDLYTPLYVPRPMVDPELYASLRPVAYSGGLGVGGSGGLGRPRRNGGLGGIVGIGGMPGGFGGQLAGRVAVRDDGKGRILDPNSGKQANAKEELEKLNDRMDLSGTARSIAQASKLGDSFQYSIDRLVTLPRQKSALLPIINKDVQATRLSIYNEEHPGEASAALGLRFKNTSGGYHLMQGPITVFDGPNYAGDARILDLQPNEERILSYAIDLGTEVNPVASAADNGRLISVKAVKGLVYTAKPRSARRRPTRSRIVTIRSGRFSSSTPSATNSSSSRRTSRSKPPRTSIVSRSGAGRQGWQAGGAREEKVVENQVFIKNRERQQHPHLPEQPGDQHQGQGGPGRRHEAALDHGEDAARRRRAGTAAECHRDGPDASACQLEGDAGHGGGVQALSREVRSPGDADRDLPEGDQASAGYRVLAEEGVRGLPGQYQCGIRR